MFVNIFYLLTIWDHAVVEILGFFWQGVGGGINLDGQHAATI